MKILLAEQSSTEPEEPLQPDGCSFHGVDDDENECPVCQMQMHLWAGFYRCRYCGYKESCCF